MTKLLGFDFGQKRTGVAIATNGDITPLTTLETQSIEKDVLGLISIHQPDELIVGIPRNLDGEDTDQTRLAREFGQRLANFTGLEVKYQDEALSSERALERIGKSATIATRKKILDQVSAQIILEDYLK